MLLNRNAARARLILLLILLNLFKCSQGKSSSTWSSSLASNKRFRINSEQNDGTFFPTKLLNKAISKSIPFLRIQKFLIVPKKDKSKSTASTPHKSSKEDKNAKDATSTPLKDEEGITKTPVVPVSNLEKTKKRQDFIMQTLSVTSTIASFYGMRIISKKLNINNPKHHFYLRISFAFYLLFCNFYYFFIKFLIQQKFKYSTNIELLPTNNGTSTAGANPMEGLLQNLMDKNENQEINNRLTSNPLFNLLKGKKKEDDKNQPPMNIRDYDHEQNLKIYKALFQDIIWALGCMFLVKNHFSMVYWTIVNGIKTRLVTTPLFFLYVLRFQSIPGSSLARPFKSSLEMMLENMKKSLDIQTNINEEINSFKAGNNTTATNETTTTTPTAKEVDLIDETSTEKKKSSKKERKANKEKNKKKTKKNKSEGKKDEKGATEVANNSEATNKIKAEEIKEEELVASPTSVDITNEAPVQQTSTNTPLATTSNMDPIPSPAPAVDIQASLNPSEDKKDEQEEEIVVAVEEDNEADVNDFTQSEFIAKQQTPTIPTPTTNNPSDDLETFEESDEEELRQSEGETEQEVEEEKIRQLEDDVEELFEELEGFDDGSQLIDEADDDTDLDRLPIDDLEEFDEENFDTSNDSGDGEIVASDSQETVDDSTDALQESLNALDSLNTVIESTIDSSEVEEEEAYDSAEYNEGVEEEQVEDETDEQNQIEGEEDEGVEPEDNQDSEDEGDNDGDSSKDRLQEEMEEIESMLNSLNNDFSSSKR